MTTSEEILKSDNTPLVSNVKGGDLVGYRLKCGSLLACLFDDTTTLYDPQGNIVEQWLHEGGGYHPTGGHYFDLPVHNNTHEGGIPIKNICVKHPKHCEECKNGYYYEGCDEPGCYILNCFEHSICEECEKQGYNCTCCKYCEESDLNCKCSSCPWCDSVTCQDAKQCYYYGEKCGCGRQATCWECECTRLER